MPHPHLFYASLGLWAGWNFSRAQQPTLGFSMSLLSVIVVGFLANERLEAEWEMVPRGEEEEVLVEVLRGLARPADSGEGRDDDVD